MPKHYLHDRKKGVGGFTLLDPKGRLYLGASRLTSEFHCLGDSSEGWFHTFCVLVSEFPLAAI
jgi:hypothetical protein